MKSGVNIGMFRLKEAIVTSDGKTIPAGRISLRAFVAE